MKYLLNSIKIVNNSFSLFTSSSENIAASADDMLSIFPYIVVKAKISRLLRQIKFIKIFEYKELQVGNEHDYALKKLEISVKIISDFKKERP